MHQVFFQPFNRRKVKVVGRLSSISSRSGCCRIIFGQQYPHAPSTAKLACKAVADRHWRNQVPVILPRFCRWMLYPSEGITFPCNRSEYLCNRHLPGPRFYPAPGIFKLFAEFFNFLSSCKARSKAPQSNPSIVSFVSKLNRSWCRYPMEVLRLRSTVPSEGWYWPTSNFNRVDLPVPLSTN